MKEKRRISRKQFLKGGAMMLLGTVLARVPGHVFAEADLQEDTKVSQQVSKVIYEPDLSSYTEITELSFLPYGRKVDSGKGDPDSLDSISVGDVFYLPIGSDIIVSIKNANIIPVLHFGKDYQSLTDSVVFVQHPGFECSWFHCKTRKICNYIGLQYESAFGPDRTMTVDELQAANPHLSIRFQGQAINTQIAAKIRTIGVKTSYKKLFTVVHLTDTHGDMDSTYAAYEYADQIEADFVALTGDYVPYGPYHGYNLIHSVIRHAMTPTVYSVGNHDAVGLTDDQAYEMNIAPIKDALQASDEHAYYYRDFLYENETVRVICLYPFYEKAKERTMGYYTEEQLLWLCETMATAPDGGHIFILRHFSHHKPILWDNDNHMFYDFSDSSTEDGINLWLNMGSDPVTDIVDAYNNKSLIFAQYTGELKDHTEAVTVKYDFSKRPNSEFVAYFTGHIHIDAVGYARHTKTKQAVLCSLCTIGWKGTENYCAYASINTPREYGTDSQIAFDVFTFDFKKKNIYVARVGNGHFKDCEKTYMELPYQ